MVAGDMDDRINELNENVFFFELNTCFYVVLGEVHFTCNVNKFQIKYRIDNHFEIHLSTEKNKEHCYCYY